MYIYTYFTDNIFLSLDSTTCLISINYPQHFSLSFEYCVDFPVNPFSPLIQREVLNRLRVTLSFCSVVFQARRQQSPVDVFALKVSDVRLAIASGKCFQRL